MKKFFIVAGAVGFLLNSVNLAHSLNWNEHFSKNFQEEKIKQEFYQTFPNMRGKIEDVERLKTDEIYQIALDNGFVLYYLKSKDGRKYVLLGGLFTAKGENLTDLKKQEILSKVADDYIDLVKQEKDRAGVIKVGNGKKVNIYAFISSGCPHCRKFYNYLLSKQNDVSAYLFFVDNSKRTRFMLCGKANVSDVMSGKYDDESKINLQGCDLNKVEPLIDKNYELAKKLDVRGVPFILIENNVTGEKGMVKGADVLLIEKLISAK